MMAMAELKVFIDSWTSDKKVGEQEFDHIFQIEGVPLWWFFRRFFVQHVIPKPVNTFSYIIDKKELSSKDKLKFNLSGLALKKYLSIFEGKKIKYFQNNKAAKGESCKKGVLFLSYTNHIQPDGRIFRLQSVIDEVKKDGQLEEKVIFADPLSSRSYRRLEGRKTIYDYYRPELSVPAGRLAKELHGRWAGISEQQKAEMLIFEGRSLWPHLKYALELFFSEEFLYLTILYYELFNIALEEENIKAALLSANNSLFEKCLMAAAAKKNIPVVIIQHGVGIDQVDPALIGKTKLAVFGEYFLQNLVQDHDVDPEAVSVVGPLVFEGIEKFKVDKEKIKDSRNVLLATSPLVEDRDIEEKIYFRKFNIILQKIAPTKGLFLTIKLHPREKYLKRYRQMLSQAGIKGTVIQEINRGEFYRLIKECDSFVNFGSTAALEAMIINRPIVTIDLFDGKWGYSDIVMKSGATIKVRYDGDLQKAVEDSFKDDAKLKKKREEFVRRLCYKVDGKEAERICEVVRGMI